MAITKISSIEDDIINRAAKQIAQEVDATIIGDFYADGIKNPVRFTIRPGFETEVEKFCTKKISPRSYYLHGPRIGGEGWQIRPLTKNGIEVIINNQQLATLMMLKWS
jgi:hypothetical protein